VRTLLSEKCHFDEQAWAHAWSEEKSSALNMFDIKSLHQKS